MEIKKVKKGVYYLQDPIKKAGKEIIDFLSEEAEKEKLNMTRCCLHLSEESILMSMIILVKNKYIYPIHKHEWKDESYSIILGDCIYEEYNDNGEIEFSVTLRQGDTLLNSNKNFHLMRPLSNNFCFIETTIGPFINRKPDFMNKL